MPDEATTYHRRSIRLKKFDYSSPGAYFVTVVSYKRANIFGSITCGEVLLSQSGEIAKNTWREIPIHFPYVTIDTYVIMPNHLHGIINIVEATHASPLPVNIRQPLGVIIGSFKSAATKRIHRAGLLKHKQIWQRNYYDHIIRDDNDYEQIYEYIESNPINWEFDHENPAR